MTSSSVDEARTARIKAAIRAESERVRARFGFLNHQDAIGASIMALSVLGMISSGWAYIAGVVPWWVRSEEHTSELQSLMRISYAVFCLKKKTIYKHSQTSQ